LKYLKTYESIDFEEFDWEEEDEYGIKVGDEVHLRNDLDKYHVCLGTHDKFAVESANVYILMVKNKIRKLIVDEIDYHITGEPIMKFKNNKGWYKISEWTKWNNEYPWII
jgi:hypothetical protein